MSSKFNTNDERLEYLRRLLRPAINDNAMFEKLAYEWLKTGVFDRKEFAAVMQIKWEQGYNAGLSDACEPGC